MFIFGLCGARECVTHAYRVMDPPLCNRKRLTTLLLTDSLVLSDTEYVVDKMHPVTMIQGKLVMNILNSMDAHVCYRWRPAPTFEGGLVVLVQDNLGEHVHVGDVWGMRVCDAYRVHPVIKVRFEVSI